jgi:DNA-binding transcriptional regulator of glucitol operon
MGNAGIIVAILLIVTWTTQMVLSLLQVRRYFKGVNALRREGRVATGMGGTRYRGRVYGVLAVNPETKMIVRAMRLGGVTVFAQLKPVLELEGRPLDSLLDDPQVLAPFPKKTTDAFRAAAQTLRDSFRDKPEEAARNDAPHVATTPRTKSARTNGSSIGGIRPATTRVKE